MKIAVQRELRFYQRARYPTDWHPHEYFMERVRLFMWIVPIGLVGAVVWMVIG